MMEHIVTWTVSKTTIAKDFFWTLNQVKPAFQKHSLVSISTLLTFLKNAVACSNSVSESEAASFLFLLHAGEAPPLFLQSQGV